MAAHRETGPANQPGYVPYFYESGRHLWYALPGQEALPISYDRPAKGSDITTPESVIGPAPTMEEIIQKGYLAIPQSEPETALISDRHWTAKIGLDDVIGQVRRRYEIFEHNLQQIEVGKCYAISSLFEQEAYRGGMPASGKEVDAMNQNLQEFYRQERDERVKLWRDVSRLRQVLPENAQSYLGAHRKLSILNDKGDPL